MEIKTARLLEILALMKPVIPKKTALASTRFILVQDGKAVATDLTTMVIADLPESKNETMLLPYAALADTAKYIPGGKLKLEVKNNVLDITWDGGGAQYPTEEPEDFPRLGEMTTVAEADMDGDSLVNAMAFALPYVAKESNRPILTGVTVMLGSPVVVAAGDGFTMSYQALGLTFPVEQPIIIPAHSAYVLAHVFAKTPPVAPLTTDSFVAAITAKHMVHVTLLGLAEGLERLRIDIGANSLLTYLVPGSPPSWIQLIPKGDGILQCQVFAPQLEAAVKRLQDIAEEGSRIVRMVFADGKITMTANDGERNIYSTIVTVFTQGEPGRMAMNYVQLLRYLGGKQGIISITQFSEDSPVLFEYQNTPKVLLMPMAVKWDGDKPAEEEPSDTAEETPADYPAANAEESVEGEETEEAEEEETGEEAEPVTTE